MSLLKIATNINIDLEFETSPFHKRFLAWVIDFVLFLIYLFIVEKILHASNFSNANDSIFFIVMFLPIVLYPVVTEFLMQGQTVGKKIVQIKVINEDGGNATISQYIIRWMLRITDFILIIAILYFIALGHRAGKQILFIVGLAITDVFCIALTKKSQRIGDMAANTIVINAKNKGSLSDTIFMETEEKYVPLYPEVMRLSDRDINMVKNILNSLEKKYNYDLADRTTWKICNALNITTKQMPIDFLETLLKDYNHISTK